MATYLFTSGAARDLVIHGIAVDTDPADAQRIAHGIEQDRLGRGVPASLAAVEFRPVAKVDAPMIAVGDLVTGTVANSLPRGSAVARHSSADGLTTSPSSALIRVRNGWRDAFGTEIGPIIDQSRYRVLFVGRDHAAAKAS